ncbi:hypothetical protein PUATCC27989T_00329 [Phytobacter ursingii]|nr:hypothetical protein PUATCC27989T_00329 [Phytobacter ursingii]
MQEKRAAEDGTPGRVVTQYEPAQAFSFSQLSTMS